MTRDDIIRMAREAGIDAETDTLCRYEGWVEPLEQFAALVVAAERNRTWPQDHWTEYERRIAAIEREECAKLAETTVCDTHLPTGVKIYGTRAAAAIRARGEK